MVAITKQKTKNKEQRTRGFTLVELLVGVAIFAFIGGIVSGILVSGLRAQRKSLAYHELLDQTSYLMEYVSRTLRMAKKDTDGTCIEENLNYQKTSTGIKFKNSQNVCQEFYLAGSQLKEEKGGIIRDLTSDDLQVTFFDIGSDDTWGQDDNFQPRVTLSLTIQGEEQSKIKIQTTISQRNPDVPK